MCVMMSSKYSVFVSYPLQFLHENWKKLLHFGQHPCVFYINKITGLLIIKLYFVLSHYLTKIMQGEKKRM